MAQFNTDTQKFVQDNAIVEAFLPLGVTGEPFGARNPQAFSAGDSPSIDAFGRWRVSNPTTLFDSKQLHDKLPLFWDEETSGGTETSTHSVADSATTMTVNANGEYVIRQTKMRFNYQPGKSQQILLTFTLGAAAPGVNKKVGYFNTSTVSPFTANEDGIYLEQDGTTAVNIVVAKNGTTNKYSQANWNIDKMDGTGPSGIDIDFTKAQIFFIDFEWLGVGRVRTGFVIDGKIYYVHEFNHANNVSSVYMSSSNHSCRYEIRSTGGAGSLMHICSSVTSEGGEDALGILSRISTKGTHTTAITENTLYAILGIRLKSTHLDTTVRLLNVALQIQGTNEYGEWVVLYNPTVAGAFTYSGITDSCMEAAVGTSSNTVTGGKEVEGNFFQAGGNQAKGGNASAEINNALRLGSKIDGTPDTFVLCFRPIGGSSNVNVEGSIFWRELT